ncbi:hypothetical protein N7463_002941 [Penicillium fimorum]|uniref:Zn(2)-C6 fungal-type domain-containing protein n=1 Tax=Penicillium fimorum TaxID=1882269 RepID=A0A9W9Y1N1_9EURO|nr:hypothetical protein N7463_002941 [Penicillium fimorum]
MPCVECTQRERQCTYERLLGGEAPLPSTSQALLETPAESGTNDDAPMVAESSWDLGLATLYPSNREVVARRRGLGFG